MPQYLAQFTRLQNVIGQSRPTLLSMGKSGKQSKFFHIFLKFHGDKVKKTLRKAKQINKKDISMTQLIYLLLNIFP